MSRDRKTLVVSMVSAAIVAIAVAPGVAGAAAGKQDVRVVNTATEPVPVAAQGVTQIAGTVNIGNTPSVSLSGLPTVDVKNDAGDPLFVQTVGGSSPSAEIPFQQFLAVSQSGLGEDCDPVDVPTGKTLRIENVSFESRHISGEGKPIAYLVVQHATESGGHSVRILGDELAQHDATNNTWSATYKGPLFVLPQWSIGESVQVCAGSDSEVRAFVTGYLFDN